MTFVQLKYACNMMTICVEIPLLDRRMFTPPASVTSVWKMLTVRHIHLSIYMGSPPVSHHGTQSIAISSTNLYLLGRGLRRSEHGPFLIMRSHPAVRGRQPVRESSRSGRGTPPQTTCWKVWESSHTLRLCGHSGLIAPTNGSSGIDTFYLQKCTRQAALIRKT